MMIIDPKPLKTLTPMVNNKSAITHVLRLPSLIGARDLSHASMIAELISFHLALSSRNLSNINIFASTLIPMVNITAANQLKEITNHINLRKPSK